MKVMLTTIALTGIVLSLLSGAVYAQGSFASVSAEAIYRIPAVDGDLKVYPTIADFAAAGYQASVSAESRSNLPDAAQNVAKSEAFFSASPSGLSVAKGYAFTGANYSQYPVNISARTQISSQYTLHVEGIKDLPFALKGYLPVHGTFGAVSFQHDDLAVASAFVGVQVKAVNGLSFYDVTHSGTVTVKSLKGFGEPDFTIAATGDFANAVTIRNNLPDPEGYNWSNYGAELSQLIVYDLPTLENPLSGNVNEDFDITFTQEITSSIPDAAYRYAYADLRNTTGFEIVAVDPTTGERLDGVISVQLVGAGGPTAAPEPASLALFGIVTLPLFGFRAARRRAEGFPIPCSARGVRHFLVRRW